MTASAPYATTHTGYVPRARSGWRFIAQREDGSGTPGAFLHWDLPLREAQITTTLSGPNVLTGRISPVFTSLLGEDDRPILEEWGSSIWAERDGIIRGGGLLTFTRMRGPELELECTGFAGYPQEQPYTDSWFGVEVDPLDVARRIWNHLQSKPGGNIGMQVSDLTSPVRIGTELEVVEFETEEGPVSFEAGPVKLNWYQTDDLGQEFDNLARDTPFDYVERHVWNGETIDHYLDFGYPRIGVRRHDLRFVIGENIFEIPTIERDGDEYASDVLVLGAGEGRNMKRGYSRRVGENRVRRAVVVADSSARSVARVQSIAKREVAARIGKDDITQVSVTARPGYPAIGAWKVGDEIRVEGRADWAAVDMWLRVLSITITPDNGDVCVMSVLRSDKIGTS